MPAMPGTISRKRGITLHISEAYEHEPILPYQPEDACPINSCNKTASQCVEVSTPVRLTPTAVVGNINTVCQGAPEVACVTNDEGSSVTVTVTQKVCVSIPVRFGVEKADDGDPKIACADGRCVRCED